MKRYLNFIKESKLLFNNLEDDELLERLQDLLIEQEDINNQISYIRNILRQREEDRIENVAKDFPESIWDLSKEQLDLILEHSNKTTDKQYEISNKYLDQLKGVMSSGFNNKTNQFYFNIVTSHSMDRDSEKFKLYEDCVKSIKFLGDNLKKMDEGYVEFGILHRYNDHGYNERVHYFSEDKIEIVFSRYDKRKVDSIEKMLEIVVNSDILSKSDDDY